jgi:hypothetical protein
LKKTILFGWMIILLGALPVSGEVRTCTTIEEGVLTYSKGHYLEGQPLQADYDRYGYNYQDHRFEGLYCNAYLGRYGFPPYEGDGKTYLTENPEAENVWCWDDRDVLLTMQWNEAWLSNRDCDGDGLLDRYYGYQSYAGSGAWLTNHLAGINEAGENKSRWSDLVKIIAVTEDAFARGEVWYLASGEAIGPQLWGAFAILLDGYHDLASGVYEAFYKSPVGPGLGKFD